ncbi:hypothetical protein [Streptomyces soliscabiei]|uniref:hypothetical protein n=1 Tax=Streptomyces soliscabiei TaxID=588897 RepID=UPI0029B99747|nr:hypothetical protein [Streptomyces sp. NY05-11A]MDX2683690.1 hypothetical protein [Streptomyces sp. NY05-11A]
MITATRRRRPRLTVDALRRYLAWALRHPSRVPPTTIVVQGAPTALFLPYATAAGLAAQRGVSIPEFTAQAGADLLLDLVFRADSLHCPAAISLRGVAAVAVVPLDWSASLAPAATAGAPVTEGN